MSARDAHNDMNIDTNHAGKQRVEGRHDRAAVGAKNTTMTRACEIQCGAAKAAKAKSTHEAAEGCCKAAKAAIGMRTQNNHAQWLHATGNCDWTAAMRSQEPLRYPPLRGQPGVPAQAQTATTQ